jgi:hypothetical protein
MNWLIDNFEIIIFLGIGSLLIFAVVYSIYLDKKRREMLRQMAPRMGFSYSAHDNSFIDGHKHLKIFSRGRNHTLTNVMEGERDGVKVMLGDYHFVTGSGKNSTHHNCTMCVIMDDSLALPNFYLRREFAFLDSLGKMFGGQDINFKEDETFSSAFVLQGTVESETRNLFSDKVRYEFLRFAKTTTQVEGQDNYVILHRGLPLEPEHWGDLLKDAFVVYEVLKNPEGSMLD